MLSFSRGMEKTLIRPRIVSFQIVKWSLFNRKCRYSIRSRCSISNCHVSLCPDQELGQYRLAFPSPFARHLYTMTSGHSLKTQKPPSISTSFKQSRETKAAMDLRESSVSSCKKTNRAPTANPSPSAVDRRACLQPGSASSPLQY